MANAPKRKSPERGASARSTRRPPPPSRASRIASASLSWLGRHPRAIGGTVCFGIIFSFVAANALWYQPRHHPAPLLATRMFEDAGSTRRIGDVPAGQDDPGFTTFRIERQSDTPQDKAARPVPSELVRQIQAALSARGLYDGPADGLTGPRTEAAILFFEQTEGMAETGEATEALLERLREVAEARPADADIKTASTERAPVDEVAALITQAQGTAEASDALPARVAIPAARPPSPSMVMKIQKGLSGMAYGDITIDGIVGESTRKAIRAFEKSYRLPVTGEPSSRVLDKLVSIGAI